MNSSSFVLLVALLSLQFTTASSTASPKIDNKVSDQGETVAKHQDVPKQAVREDSDFATEFGLPSNESLPATPKGSGTDRRSSIPTRLVYPLKVYAKYKAKLLRELLLLPYRTLEAPIEIAKMISQTSKAIRRPFDVRRWSKVSSELTRMKATTEKPPELPLPMA